MLATPMITVVTDVVAAVTVVAAGTIEADGSRVAVSTIVARIAAITGIGARGGISVVAVTQGPVRAPAPGAGIGAISAIAINATPINATPINATPIGIAVTVPHTAAVGTAVVVATSD